LEVISISVPSEEDIINVAAIAKTSYHDQSYEYWKEQLTYDAAMKFLTKLITGKRPSDRHESTLEPLMFTFNITNISRIVTHQLVRHRMASYMQKSLRSKRKLTHEDFVYPVGTENLTEYSKAVKALIKLYEDLIEKGESPDDARRILPIGIATEITVTINARSLRNFLKQRLAKSANWEMRNLARLIVLQLIEHKLGYLIEDIIVDYNENRL